MKTLIRIQEIPAMPYEAWSFFSSPANLKIITPKHMGFEKISDIHLDKIYSGIQIV